METTLFIPGNMNTLKGRFDHFRGVQISTYNGVLKFNRETLSDLNLKPGDKVSFEQNKDDNTQWFIKLHNEGFELKRFGSYQAAIYNQAIARLVLDSMGFITIPSKHKWKAAKIKMDKYEGVLCMLSKNGIQEIER